MIALLEMRADRLAINLGHKCETDMTAFPALAALVAFVNEWRKRERRRAKPG